MLQKTRPARKKKSPSVPNDESARLYKVLQIICGFSRPEDLFELKKPNFLRLCGITQIHWELSLFRNGSRGAGTAFSEKSAPEKSATLLRSGTADSNFNEANPAQDLRGGGKDKNRDGGKNKNQDQNQNRDGISVSQTGSSAPFGPLKGAPTARRFERALTSGGRKYGKLIFTSSRKISRKQKTFLSRTGDMVSSSLRFMEDSEQLEASKNQWDLVFDSFYRALCITDSQFRILRANGAFRRLTGRQKTETAGQNVFTVFPVPVSPPPSQQQEEEVTWLAESPREDPPLSLEFLMKTVVLKNERLTFRLFLIKDVTEEIKMERKIADQTRSRELGLIKSSLAHELNNPIAGIKALLTVIESGLTCPSQRRLLGNMHSAVDRCQETVSRLLSVSRQDRFNRKADAV